MRELEVLRLVADGRSNREIAGELFISVKTASVPVSNILGRVARRRRFGVQLWTLLHARALPDGPATAAGSTSFIEDDYRRFTARREIPVHGRQAAMPRPGSGSV